MANDPLTNPWKRYGGQDYRRSSRVKCHVPLLVYGQNVTGEKFVERTHVTDLNLHGCGFVSRHNCPPGSYVTLRFGGERYEGKDKVVRAQVKRSDADPSPRRLSRIGVELGIPGNVWSYAPVPLDWRKFLGSPLLGDSPAPAPILVAPEKPAPAPVSPVASIEDTSMEIHLELSPITVDPVLPEPLSPPAPPQELIDAAVTAAIDRELEPAIARALSTLELQTRASMRQLRETTAQRHSPLSDPTRNSMEQLFNERLSEIRSHWDVQLDAYLVRMEECAQRVERQAAAAQQQLSTTRDMIERAMQSFSQQLDEQVSYAVKRAAQLIGQKASTAIDHQIIRLTEDAHFVAREINSVVESDSASAREEMRATLGSILEEFRTESELHAKRMTAEARQKLSSSLAALDAEHQSLIDHRRKMLDGEIRQTGAKLTAEFRQSFKAFFYSCLVAAVGAVEEHSKTTLEGFSADPDPPTLPKP